MRRLHVGTAQIHSGGGVQDVLSRIERQARAAGIVGVEVLLFSEVVLQGYDYEMTAESVRASAESADGESAKRISALARETGVTLLVGFLERDGDKICNSHLVARPDGLRQVQRKHALTDGERKAGLTAGPKERTIFTFNGVRSVIVICADTGVEGRHEDLITAGVDYQFIPTGGGGKIQDYLHEADLAGEEAQRKYTENRPRICKTEAICSREECPSVGYTSSNAMGPVGAGTCHQGHCIIVDNQRVLRAQICGSIILEHLQDQMVHAELTFS